MILALATLCAAASPSRAEQASAKDHGARVSAPRARASVPRTRASVPRARPSVPRERASTAASRGDSTSAATRVKTQPPARKKPRLLDPWDAIRAFLVRPSTALAAPSLPTADLQWSRAEWDTRPVAATTSGFVPALSTDDWRLLLAAGLNGFALVSPITPSMGFPGLRTHQRPPAGLLCLAEDGLDVCLPAISAVKDPYDDRRWAGVSVRVFEARF